MNPVTGIAFFFPQPILISTWPVDYKLGYLRYPYMCLPIATESKSRVTSHSLFINSPDSLPGSRSLSSPRHV